MLVLDYYSCYIKILKLTTTTSADVICQLKSIFARHGIPEELVSDNGPQYTAEEFACFAKKYGFQHQTSNPKFPQANGEAERAVKSIKALLNKTDDPFLGLLLLFHSTGIWVQPSGTVDGTQDSIHGPKLLHPELPNRSQLCSKERKIRDWQKRNFDHHHRARSLEPLLPGETVWLPDNASDGKVVEKTAPWSYVVETPTGKFWRNRRHIVPMPAHTGDQADITTPPTTLENSLPIPPSSNDPNIVCTRSSRVSKPPDRFS